MINIKNLDSNLIKIDKKSYKNININCFEYITIGDIGDCESIYSVNLFYLIIGKVDGYIEEKHGNKYSIVASAGKNKEVLKDGEIWDGIKMLVGKIDNKPINWDNLPLNKILKLHNLTIIVVSVF